MKARGDHSSKSGRDWIGMKKCVRSGVSLQTKLQSRNGVAPNRHRPGARNFSRSRPALLSTWQPPQFVGVGVALAVVSAAVAGAAAVVAAGALATLYRESRG
jgi:hypothetical protein